MSKVKIQGNASGTGVVTLTAPNTNTDRTITLPDSSDTLVSTAPSTSGNILTSDGTNWTSAAPAAAGADTSLSNLSATGENKVAQGWVKFRGYSSVVVRDSHNVSSITDNGTGDWTANWTVALANQHYVMAGTSSCDLGFSANTNIEMSDTVIPTASALRFYTSYVNSTNNRTLWDPDQISVLVFGD